MELVIHILMGTLLLIAIFTVAYIFYHKKLARESMIEIPVDMFLGTFTDEPIDVETLEPRPLLIKIVRCSNQFAWYTELAKLKDFDKDNLPVMEKIFRAELITDEALGPVYRTIDDVMGPDVKGFINIADAEEWIFLGPG
jgi:hypothetical protein